MKPNKRIGLVAHDAKKRDLLEWVDENRVTLERHELWGTGTTGGLVADRLGLPVHRLKSGPLGGDQQMGALIAEGRLDILIFFTDPLSTMPHDVDVKALVRLSTVYGIAMACNRTTADFLIASPLFNSAYDPDDTDYSEYISRHLDRI